MHRKGIFRASLALFFCFLTVSSVYAESLSAIRGRVGESGSSRPISGARVRLISISSGEAIASALTDTNGNYELKGLSSPAVRQKYLITLSREGYALKSASYYFIGGRPYFLNFSLDLAPSVPTPVPASTFAITFLKPTDGTIFLAGALIEIKVAAASPANGPPVQYLFSIGGSMVRPWSGSNTYSWQTRSSDKGRVEVTCEARNSSGRSSSRSISLRILDPTVEEVLQKVADNYAKIQDFKADMVLSSTLDGQPFGETEYCRYYFKSPNKEKTEAYADSSRAALKEIMITDGAKMTMIDPVNNLRQEVDLLQETGLTDAQFNQMSLYYNQGMFLRNHTVSKNISKTDFNSFIIALDVMPREPNNLYSKLELYVDYSKGILAKSCLYKADKLIQTIEEIEAQQLSNGFWFSRTIRKIPILKSGNLAEMANYSNIQINVGLIDIDFNS